jgi:hypothetical protein
MARVSLPKFDTDRDPIDVTVLLAGILTVVVLLCTALFAYMLLS